MSKKVIKRDGTTEDFNADKLLHWLSWGMQAINEEIDFTSIAVAAVSKIENRITSQDLQKVLIQAVLERETWSHYLLAGKLYGVWLMKHIYGDKYPTVKELHSKLQGYGLMIDLGYTDEEYAEIETIINHEEDMLYPHFRTDYLVRKYGIRDIRVNREYGYETPQFIYMRVAMAVCSTLTENKMLHIKNLYTTLSKGLQSAPTPNFVNFGTPLKGFASCCLFEAGDTADSIGVAAMIAYTMTCQAAGTSVAMSMRSLGDSVRNGLIEHQGKLPYFRLMEAAVGSNLQNGRGGALTATWFAFDPEGLDITFLQDPKSPEEKRIRGIDYSMFYNHFFAAKAAKNETVFAFNHFTAPKLMELMFSGDKEAFAAEYNRLEADTTFKKTYFNARDRLVDVLTQAEGTGRYYVGNLDEINHHTPFLDPIKMSNLCQEILSPVEAFESTADLLSNTDVGYIELRATDEVGRKNVIKQPYAAFVNEETKGPTYFGRLALNDKFVYKGTNYKVDDIIASKKEPEVSICNIAAVTPVEFLETDGRNGWTPTEVAAYESQAYYSLLMIDEAINQSVNRLQHVDFTTRKRRNAGVGIMGQATFMAKFGLSYTTAEGKAAMHRLAELHMYSLLRASLRLGKERGNAEWIHRTKYPSGWLPIDTYNRNVDSITDQPLLMDWESLRADIIANGGIRNSCVGAIMPGESSSKANGQPNSLYPIREIVHGKSDSRSNVRFAAKNSDRSDYVYESHWDIGFKDAIEMYALWQKFIDQGISADLWRKLGPGEHISSREILSTFFLQTKLGLKTRYYIKTLTSINKKLEDGSEVLVHVVEESDGPNCADGVCSM